MSSKNTTVSGTLSAGVAASLVTGNLGCSLMIIANNGVNPMVVKFQSAPTSATDGIPLDGASVSGGQGGSLVLTGEDASIDSVFGFSTLGTTFGVTQGIRKPV